MKTLVRFTAMTLMVILALCVTLNGNAQDKKITKKDVPAAVLASFQKAYPDAKITGYLTETEGGKMYYEIESIHRKMTIDALILPDGTIYEVEEGVAAKDLPAPVSAAVSTKYPKAKIKKAEKTTHGTAVSYDLQIVSGKNQATLEVDPTGKILKESKGKAVKEEKEEKEEKEKD